MIIIGYSTVLY